MSSSSKKEPKELFKENALPNYQLGDLLGKGASGQVFRALNFTNGETVAVKQIQLTNIPKSELGEIMSEIHLLKNLNHPNIVKYTGFVKTKEFLYIILEYCENGSLHAICKRFGKFPENLVAVYISQVLEGLVYLHEQGVIHRDIKGANILTNKDGRVKLADFGVATPGGVNDSAVVGSPYWMAPEVIEQAGASTASDIWSVGCVVIELLEGKPPYHALEPMQALFRIVQDDSPPIPPGASEIVKDFLLACFQKDPNLRVSAKKLLRHGWMSSARRQMEKSKESVGGMSRREGGTTGSGGRSAGGSGGRSGRARMLLEGDKTSEEPPAGISSHDERIHRVKEWNEKLEKTSYGPVASSSGAALRDPSSLAGGGRRPSSGYGATHFPPLVPSGPGGLGLSPNITPSGSLAEALSAITKSNSPLATAALPVGLGSKTVDQAALMRKMEESQEFSDNWDDDFAEGISLTKLNARDPSQDAGPADEQDGTDHWDQKTIKPSTRSPSLSGSPLPPVASVFEKPTQQRKPSVEDWSDMADGEDDLGLSSKVAQLSMSNRRGLYHPSDISSLGFSSTPSSPHPPQAPPRSSSNPLVPSPKPSIHSGLPPTSLASLHSRRLSHPIAPPTFETTPSSPNSPLQFASLRLTRTKSDTAAGFALDASTKSPPGSQRVLLGDRDRRGSGSGGEMSTNESAAGSRITSDLKKYSEGVEEDYEDVFGKSHGRNAIESPTLQLNTKLSNKSWLGDNDDEVDPFAEIEEAYEDDADLDTNLQREEHARLAATITDLVDQLHPQTLAFELSDICDQILNIVAEIPEMQAHFVSCHGMLAILEVLETKPTKDVILRMLRIVNIVNFQDVSYLESFCLIGGIPIILPFTTTPYGPDCQLEAAIFISAVCSSSIQTLQMFISCRGLKVLVNLLDEDYTQSRDLVICALEGIGSVFRLQGPTTRKDFCRMFIRLGIEDALSTALVNITSDEDEGAAEAKVQILAVFLMFCQASQKDSRVRQALASRTIIRRVLNTCGFLDPALLVILLKAIYHLSTSPSTLEVLQNANAIQTVTDVLGRNLSGPHSTEISNHVLQTLYKLCWLNKSRQEEAAQAGIIPLLKKIIKSPSPLRQFAVPILLDLANAGKATRTLLWQQRVLPIYLELVSEPDYWQGQALEAVAVWLHEETSRVEEILTEEPAATQLLRCFVGAKAAFEKILEPFLKIIRSSPTVTLAISKPAFFRRLVERLTKISKPHVRLSLLRITRVVTENNPDGPLIAERHGLLDIVEKLGKQDGAILVQGLALEILPFLRPKKTSASRQPALLARHPIRRTTSESTVPLSSPTSSSTSSHLPRSPSVFQASQATHKRKPSRAQLSEIRWTDGAEGTPPRPPSSSSGRRM